MKIELKEIVHYLPYDLKLFGNEKMTLVGIFNDFTYLCKDKDNENFLMSSIKPILRPIKDLGKPCLPDNKVPIQELAKMSDFCDPYNEKNKIYNQKYDNEIELNYSYKCIHESFSYYPEEKIFSYRDEDNNYTINQYQLFEKLFEWNFDVFNWIDNGLAIDINSINDN